jgi:hypothetical protein
VISWLLAQADQSQTMRQSLIDSVWRLIGGTEPDSHSRNGRAKRVAELERQAANLAQAIATGGRLEVLVEKLKSVEDALQKARASAICSRPEQAKVADLRTKTELNSKLGATMLGLADHSFEFADWLRRLIPELVIQPVQALDTPLVRPRGKLRVRLASLIGASAVDSSADSAEHEVTLDLFEPPRHIAAIPDCLLVRASHSGWSLAKIASHLKLNRMTVKRAIDYARRMKREGLDTPYRELIQPPGQASRWRRRKAVRPGGNRLTPGDDHKPAFVADLFPSTAESGATAQNTQGMTSGVRGPS